MVGAEVLRTAASKRSRSSGERCQELARSSAQENEWQKKRRLLNSAQSAEEQNHVSNGSGETVHKSITFEGRHLLGSLQARKSDTSSRVARDSHHRTATEQAFAFVLVSFIGSGGRPLGMFGIKLIETMSTSDVFIKEFEDVGLPLRDGQVEEVVPFVRRLTDRRIDLQEVGFVEAVEFGGEGSARSCIVVVGCVDEHGRGGSFADCRQQALAKFGRALPGISAVRRVSIPPNECPAIAMRLASIPGLVFKKDKAAATSSS